jgi:hypothetical protein
MLEVTTTVAMAIMPGRYVFFIFSVPFFSQGSGDLVRFDGPTYEACGNLSRLI